MRVLEPHVGWRARDVADPAAWTVELSAADHRELDHALATAKARSHELLSLGCDAFPLDRLAIRIAEIERELLDGRGFVLIRGLDVSRYGDEDLTLLYWGLGLHLGDPWPQNHHGHVMGDVTDQQRSPRDPHARGNEIGEIALEYHTDGSDLVGLLCLRAARSGGLSCIANAVAIHNELVTTQPELVAALYEELPFDYRGEQPPGGARYYLFPCFTEHADRLFVRFIPSYIRSSQRYREAPRLSIRAREAIAAVQKLARDPEFNVCMDLRPGDVQFINNYHVLHGRTAYVDDPASKRHLKRLWLATRSLPSRPAHFAAVVDDHWVQARSVSRIAT
jgi:hypothetical protein